MIIRGEQRAAYRKNCRRQFEERTFRELREDLPEETADLSDAELRSRITEGADQAEHYGIVFEDDVQLYIAMMVIHGRNFARDPGSWAGRIVHDHDLSGEEKVNALLAEHENRMEAAP